MIIRDDASVLLLQADENGDLDEVSLPDEIGTTQWRSGCLYHDKHQSFDAAGTSSKEATGNEMLLCLLDSECKLSVGRRHTIHSNPILIEPQLYRLSDMKLLAVIQGVDCLPPVLSIDPPKRANIRETLTEFVIADLGDTSTVSPCLIVRNSLSLTSDPVSLKYLRFEPTMMSSLSTSQHSSPQVLTKNQRVAYSSSDNQTASSPIPRNLTISSGTGL